MGLLKIFNSKNFLFLQNLLVICILFGFSVIHLYFIQYIFKDIPTVTAIVFLQKSTGVFVQPTVYLVGIRLFGYVQYLV